MILVDIARKYPTVSVEARRRGHAQKAWCHMTSDTSLEELHAFAVRLGLLRQWFDVGRYAHYDLTEGMRANAIRLGAREVSARELVAASKRLAAADEVKPCK